MMYLLVVCSTEQGNTMKDIKHDDYARIALDNKEGQVEMAKIIKEDLPCGRQSQARADQRIGN